MYNYNGSEISKTELRKLVDFLPYPIIIWERRQNEDLELFYNAKFIAQIGYSLKEASSRNLLLELLYPDKIYRDEILRCWLDQAAAIARGEQNFIKMKVHLTCSSGERRWFEIKASVLNNLYITAYVDINSDVLLQENLKKANANNEMMLSVLGHDLRSPVANLIGISSLAMDLDFSHEELVPMMRQIREESVRVLELLDNTVNWAKFNFNSLQVHSVPIDFNILVKGVLQSVKLSCDRKNITIVTDLDRIKNIENDFEILTIIVRNLISNAVKFTPKNGVISITSAQNEVIISDNGVGMSAEKLEMVRNRNSLSSRGTENEKGSGLGLQLVFNLAEKINCRLEIQSTEAEGTSVRIIFFKK
ncbi:ATP-binding protein [Flavobacterium sp. DGU38]|uniref:histidine kinase n=1 Tax=Flavobacterium calami TaxID=3139144 RepID=A0ABU9IP63_9FLAO